MSQRLGARQQDQRRTGQLQQRIDVSAIEPRCDPPIHMHLAQRRAACGQLLAQQAATAGRADQRDIFMNFLKKTM